MNESRKKRFSLESPRGVPTLDEAYRTMRPADVCVELSRRFEVQSLSYYEDRRCLWDRLDEHEVWADLESNAHHFTGMYDIPNFGPVYVSDISFMTARSTFRWRPSELSQADIQISSDVSNGITDASKRLDKQISSLSPLQFEEFVAELLYKRGYKTYLTPATCDNGVDIFAMLYHSTTQASGEATLVQCKKTARVVGTRIVRELAGAKLLHAAERALLVTTSHYSARAHAVVADANYYHIDLADLTVLRNWWLSTEGYSFKPRRDKQ